MGERWYALKAQPRKEALAELHLRRQGFKTYFPRIIVASPQRARPGPARGNSTLAGLFPGYLFVRTAPERGGWRSINGTMGVIRLVQFGDTPSPVPAGMIESLTARTDARGVLSFEENLELGASVRLVGGAFDGLIGTLQGQDANGRVRVLMDVMARHVTISAPRGAVMRAA